GRTAVDHTPFFVDEEERILIAVAVVNMRDDDRTSQRKAEVVLSQRRLVAGGEEIAGIHLVVAEKLVERSVEGSRTTLALHQYLGRTGHTILRAVVVLQNAELRNRVQRRRDIQV